MSFTFKPATRDRIGLLFGIAGASGSGKTYSALLLGQGIANGKGQLAVVDTEAGRAKHYANDFKFLHGDFSAPFSPKRYIEAVRASEEAGSTVTVIDSMSHEWAGEGGCSDMQAMEAERMATDKAGNVVAWKIEAMTMPAWKRPKIEHKRMMSRLVQTRTHLIFCLRAEEKIKVVKEKDNNGREKSVIVPIGFQPIQERSFMFETSGFITMHPDTPGLVRYDQPHKLNKDLQHIFRDGYPVTLESGNQLREWAETGADVRVSAEEQKIIDAVMSLIERLEDAPASDAVRAIVDDAATERRRAWLQANRPALSGQLEGAITVAEARTAVNADGDENQE